MVIYFCICYTFFYIAVLATVIISFKLPLLLVLLLFFILIRNKQKFVNDEEKFGQIVDKK